VRRGNPHAAEAPAPFERPFKFRPICRPASADVAIPTGLAALDLSGRRIPGTGGRATLIWCVRDTWTSARGELVEPRAKLLVLRQAQDERVY
jgi:hypothetical protein